MDDPIQSSFLSSTNHKNNANDERDRRDQILKALRQLGEQLEGTIYYDDDDDTGGDSSVCDAHSSDRDDVDEVDEHPQPKLSNTSSSFCQASHVWSERSIQGNDGLRRRRRPWVVIEVANEADVQRTLPVLVDLQVRWDFPFRVRSGGHNKAGHSTVAGGAVLSLVRLNHIRLLDMNDTAAISATSSINGNSTTRLWFETLSMNCWYDMDMPA